MCGIAGIIGLGTTLGQEDRDLTRTMASLLRHRGPDQTGHRFDERCALGNTRLKVIDPSDSADLPMTNADGTVWICYNGEVTNFRELKKEHRLGAKYAFRSTSDTEVLIHLYEELGIRFVDELSGMFAFCLYDSRLGKAWLVRDQFGIRPVFYLVGPDRLFFASEIKALLDVPCFDGRLDYTGLFDFFSLAYIPEEHTPFEMIRELQGGRLMEIDVLSGRRHERSYYEVKYEADHSLTEKEWADALYLQMRDSVRRNLISDAPVGMTFSGGFDTSAILALARETMGAGREFHTFSIVMKEPSYNEARWQHAMADPADPTHHEVPVGPEEVLETLVEHMAFMDEPSGDGAAIPFHLLAREATKYVTVMLSGEGGDETFNAYETHAALKMRAVYRRFAPRASRRFIHWITHALPTNYKKLSFDFLAKRFTEGAELSVPEAHLYWRHPMTEEHKRALIPTCRDHRPTSQLFTDLYESLDFADDLDRLSVMDLKHYFIGDLMVKNDRTMMAHSLEARFPLMDRILLDFVARIPAELRIKGFKRRYIQKLAMKGRLPKLIHNRRNMGLEMPHSLWFLSGFRRLGEQYFSKKNIEKTGFLHHGTVKRLWEEHLAGRHDHGRGLWCLLNLLVWFDLFVYDGNYKSFLKVPS